MKIPTDFNFLAQALLVTTREGDQVQVQAPLDSAGRKYNEMSGVLRTSSMPGWIFVELDDVGVQRFRADELIVL